MKAKHGMKWMALLLLAWVGLSEAQLSRLSEWNKSLKNKYDVTYNIGYGTAHEESNRLDLYVPRDATNPVPVLIWIHGGGWNRLSKDSITSQLVPYLRMGWVVVNVDYRLTPVAIAPAAVEDCRCVLAWIAKNAGNIKADLTRIVVSGTSSGGHLALMTGMLPNGTQLDRLCPINPAVSVAAIVNFYGITDVTDLLKGPNRRGYASSWLGDGPNRAELAKQVSPLSYIRKDLPPILTIHGDADPTVPYNHAVMLHKKLDEFKVPNYLMTIPDGQHGRFSREQNESILAKIHEFLKAQNIIR